VGGGGIARRGLRATSTQWANQKKTGLPPPQARPLRTTPPQWHAPTHTHTSMRTQTCTAGGMGRVDGPMARLVHAARPLPPSETTVNHQKQAPSYHTAPHPMHPLEMTIFSPDLRIWVEGLTEYRLIMLVFTLKATMLPCSEGFRMVNVARPCPEDVTARGGDPTHNHNSCRTPASLRGDPAGPGHCAGPSCWHHMGTREVRGRCTTSPPMGLCQEKRHCTCALAATMPVFEAHCGLTVDNHPPPPICTHAIDAPPRCSTSLGSNCSSWPASPPLDRLRRLRRAGDLDLKSRPWRVGSESMGRGGPVEAATTGRAHSSSSSWKTRGGWGQGDPPKSIAKAGRGGGAGGARLTMEERRWRCCAFVSGSLVRPVRQ
jgi:hypothetical protein